MVDAVDVVDEIDETAEEPLTEEEDRLVEDRLPDVLLELASRL